MQLRALRIFLKAKMLDSRNGFCCALGSHVFHKAVHCVFGFRQCASVDFP
jgi:hypothetical protein